MAGIILNKLPLQITRNVTKIVACTCALVLGIRTTWKIIIAIKKHREKVKYLEVSLLFVQSFNSKIKIAIRPLFHLCDGSQD